MSDQYLGVGGRMVTVGGKAVKMPQAIGDMQSSVYDPQGKRQDIFKFVTDEIAKIPTTDVSSKLDKTGDGSNVTAAFTAASTRANIATGEKLSVLFGKITKWLADLGSLAFKSTVAKSDLANDVQTSLGKADSALQSVSKSDVGLGNVANERQYSSENPPPYPVTSVNGKTGAVTVSVPTVPSTTDIIKGNGSGGLVAATRGSDYIASGNIVKQTLVATETTPTEDYAINWVYGN